MGTIEEKGETRKREYAAHTAYRLWERTPAQAFWDAHYLGNGQLGLTVTGEQPLEEIAVNDDTLWSGSENFYLNPGHYESFIKARELALRGETKAANDVVNDEMEGRWLEAYMPLASLHITTGQGDNRRNMPLKRVLEPKPDAVSQYHRELRLDEAVERISWVRDGIFYERSYFVSHPQDMAFLFCTARRLPLTEAVGSGSKVESGVCDGGKEQAEKVLQMAFGLDSKLHHANGAVGQEAYVYGMAPEHAEPSYTPVTPALIYGEEKTSQALRFACCARVIDSDGEVESDGQRVYVSGASYALLAVQARTNYRGFRQQREQSTARLLETVRAELGEIGKRQEEAGGGTPENASDSFRGNGTEQTVFWRRSALGSRLLKEHREDYQALYGRVSIDLGPQLSDRLPTSERLACCAEGADDPSLAALMAQYARYLTIAASRPGSQAMNLQGIWNTSVTPPWSSNYTNNINVEMNYWPSEVMGLPECHLPLMELVKELSQAGERTAKEYYHGNGWVVHHNTDLWRDTEPACEDSSWSWWPMGGAWLCQHIWTHYEYTKDAAFLRQYYPVLRGAAQFFLDFLTEKDGQLVTAPSISPENKYIIGKAEETEETVKELIEEIGKGSRCSSDHPCLTAVTVGSTMDMSLLRELFANLAQASQILGMTEDPLSRQAREAMTKFPPYRTGRYGQLLEWEEDYEECSPGMGHISQMYPVYPGHIISETKTPELFAAARRALERRQLHVREAREWPGAWRVALMARFKNSLECGHLLKSAGEGFGAGLLTKGSSQIDAIFGYGAGIAEMLLQSHQGYIELLPAVPVDWRSGYFRGLRARGGYTVDAVWENGRLADAYIMAAVDGICKVKAVGLVGAEPVGQPERRKAEIGARDILTFAVRAGETYRLRFRKNEIANREYQI